MTTAIAYAEFGGPEVLHEIPVPEPVAGAGQLVIRVTAAGVNPIDVKLRSGRRASAEITEPRRIGSDGAGVVTGVGEGVDGFRVGDPVVFASAAGAYATDIAVPASRVFPRPPQVSAAHGAALGIPVGTAYQALRSLAVSSDDTVLVHAGSGAVGQALIQFAVLWGATVVATSSEGRFDRVRELGALPVAYGEGLIDRVREAAPQGVTVAVDAAGTDEALDTSLELVADRQRIATLVRGRDAAGRGIRAFSGGSPEPLTAQQQAWRTEAVPVALALIAAGRFSVELGPSFALADAAEAHRAIESGVAGKITLVP
ncbi:NADP-dependent oxidoreductase [Microbacterium trichothecenolyticum]|uniref:NADP-dependent oxidoreductase n=1 Tax=Microbacterium ureisolvens TaxID=2781186 RepID=A0ABS7I0J7_9MICO|nr:MULTISPECIES: NADP-dependent oxidoreductase [Microbacterium]MBW9110905.1 NADP-dependent oxidoreductase [Microbacterium ureisolvens]MBW9121057.1 NADP-dependent oxidoreductase [Microbacterium trichothecenolyticum]